MDLIKLFRTLLKWIICFAWLAQLSSGCPDPALLLPCKCEFLDTTVIICGGSDSIDLSSVFRRLSTRLAQHMRHFGVFYLSNTAIKSLPAFVFHNITFRHIYFDGAFQLRYLDPNSFIGTHLQIEYINAWNTNLESYKVPNENDAFSPLSNLKYLDISNHMYCPNDLTIKPCTCKVDKSSVGSHFLAMRDSYSIHCEGNEPYFIRQVFQRISSNEALCGRHFDNLYLDNHLWTNLTEIPEDAFAGVTFSNIYLAACKECHKYRLTIHPKAFGKSKLFVQSLIFSTNVDSRSNQFRDTFVAVNSLVNVRHIAINAGFESLSAHTFRPVTSGAGLTRLKTITIRGNTLRRIESYAFYAIPNLDFIDLSMNKIQVIERHSFAFRQRGVKPLLLDLRANDLSSGSFEKGSLSHIQRPVELVLFSQTSHCSKRFQYLDEDVFAPFLACNTRNMVQLGVCPLLCDCNMKWLFEAPQHWRLQVRGGADQTVANVRCLNENSLFNKMSRDFENCISDCDQNVLQMNIHSKVVCKRTKTYSQDNLVS